jgi:sugar transferase (PEP-CTERM system associated)
MMRWLNHYFSRQALLACLTDLGLIVLFFTSACLLWAQWAASVPAAASYGLSLAAGLLLVNSASGLYRPARNRSVGQSSARAALAFLLSLPLTYIIFGVLPLDLGDGEALRWVATGCVAGVIAHRVYARHVVRPADARSRLLIFGAGAAAQQLNQAVAAANVDVQIVGYVSGPNESNNVIDSAHVLSRHGALNEQALALGVDEIVVALEERRGGSMPLRELLDCKVAGIRVSDLSTYFEQTLLQIRIDHVRAGWLIFGDGFSQKPFRRMTKRLLDIVVSMLLIAVVAPLMVLTALAIRLESRGPILYAQERVGQDGRLFRVLKFRSMRLDAEKDGKPKWAAKKDNRITQVGAVIRRFRIDELPQIVNVLKGDMSLVGPRPERPFFVDQLRREIPYYAVRHSVKPGVTGWAQVRYQYGATIEDSLEKLQYDLYYVKNHSIFLDIVILLETVGVVLSGKGAR